MTPASKSNASYDVIVIGGGVGGLVAAAYLARARARVLLLEARDFLGGCAETVTIAEGFRAPLLAHTLYALDGRVVRDLRLFWRGLAFAERDMKLVALRPGGAHIVVARRGIWAQNGIAVLTRSDLAAYGWFRRDTLAFARRLRPLWRAAIDSTSQPEPLTFAVIARRLQLSLSETDRLVQLERLSAAAYLDHWFESDALRAALSFDVGADGLSPHEAGSALALVWRLAQESCGRQAAVSQPQEGLASLVAALVRAAKYYGAELRTGARVASIAVENESAAGVVLERGEVCRASAVISNLDARQTLVGLVPPGVIGLGAAASVPEAGRVASAKLIIALSGRPPVAGLDHADLRNRLVVAGRPESAAEAKGAALAGELPEELVMEATVPTVADPQLAHAGKHLLSVLVPYVPASPKGGWDVCRDVLGSRVIETLEGFAPGLKDRIVAVKMLTPDDIALRYGLRPGPLASPLSRLLSTYDMRVRTALPGLFLCGSGTEPISAISGRAGRVAAALSWTELVAAKRRRR